jgi:hypothetical protein
MHRGKTMTPKVLPILLLISAFSSPIASQAADPATVTFSLNFPHSDPESYTISVTSDGHARYECSARISDQSEDRETYQTDFLLSDSTRTRVFDLASEAHYFTGKIDSGNHKLAFTGAKKLVYTDGQRNNTADYNYSTVPAVQQLTTLFQNIAATLEYGRHITYMHRYQKLALDDELKLMEDQARRGDLAELQAVKPLLQQLFDDKSVLNVVRARAQRIMEMGDSVPTAQKR